MRPTFFFIAELLLFSTFIALLSGCDESLEFSNTPPGSLSISRNICYLGPNDSVTLTGQASDADEDSLTYSWRADEGTLTPPDGSGRVVEWRAPDNHGTYRVTLKVTDGLDESSKNIDIDVGRKLEVHISSAVISETDYPYIVQDPFPHMVSEFNTLTIEEGVTVVFSEPTGGLNVQGTLIVNGTAQNRVLMTANAECQGDILVWRGVEISGEEASGDLKYFSMSSTADGLTVEDGAYLIADNLVIDQSTGDGLSVTSGGSAEITNSRMWDNGGGIYVENGILNIQNSSIRYNNNYGFSMFANVGTFDVDILGCVVANNQQYCFVLASWANPIIQNCSMYFNGPDGRDGRTVMLSSGYANTNDIDMRYNYWATTAETEIEQRAEIERQIEKNGANVNIDYSDWLIEPPSKNR
jgi:hypothetical protein